MNKIRQKTMLATILLFWSFLAVSASEYSDSQKLTLNLENAPLRVVFDKIESQSEFIFIYKEGVIDPAIEVNLVANQLPVARVLDQVLANSGIKYEIINRQIILTPDRSESRESSPPEVSSLSQPQQRQVSGRVTDTAGRPIPGATVVVEGTTSGTATDLNGEFSLMIPSDADSLTFSFIGMKTLKLPVGNQTQFSIVMEEETIGLEEVVAVGYGTMKQVNLTGAVSSVKGDVLENRPIGNVSSGLQGMLPGVTISSSSGQPGRPGTSILVRGVNTINSSTSPLILIDGVAGGDINLLNPEDIENVSVLKDAASAAIYGSRAANGVILITTKQGKSQEKTAFSYSGFFGVQTPVSLPELVNGRQYMTLENEARRARGVAIPYSAEAFMKYDSKNFPNDYSNTDWISETYKDYSTQQNHNFNINGKSGKSAYYMSYGYLDQTGLIVGDPYSSNRHNIRLRLNTEVTEHFKLDGNLSYIDYYRRDAGGSGTGGVFRLSQRISPLLPVRWQLPADDGGWYNSPYWSYGSVQNPVRTAYKSGYTKTNSRTLNGIINAILTPFRGLQVKSQYSYNYYTRDVKDWNPTMPRFLADGTPHAANDNIKNSIYASHRSILTQTFTTTADYEKSLGYHSIKLLGGFSQDWAYLPVLSASRRSVLLEGVEEIDGGTEEIANSGTAEHWALRSWFGRVNYDFEEKYLFEANLRYDGTSRFAEDNRWGLFPSFSAGWKFSQEEFMEFLEPVLTVGKLRASWGELGNQDISNSYYPYLTEIERQPLAYPIGNRENVGFAQISLANENIKWETHRMLNLGLDLRMLNNQLNFSFDWFKKENINALLLPIYPTVIGVTSSANLPLENIGSIENKGWEVNVSWRDRIGGLNYGLTANLSDAQNEVTDLGTSAPYLGNNIRREGDPVNAYYGYLTDGLAQVDDFASYDEANKRYLDPQFAVISSYASIIQPGDIIYRDISGEDGVPDGKIDDYDKVVFGNPYPRYSYSLRGYLEYRNFDFSFYFQGVGKVNGYLDREARHAFINDYSVPKTAHLDRWTPNNPGASYPRMYYEPSHNIEFSDYWLEDASYLRLKNVYLGYTIPKHITEKININRFKVYLSIDNLFTLTNYFGGFDPEVRETSGDVYPQLKTFAIGVQLGF